MSVVSADLVAYHAAAQSAADGVPVGGAIDTLRRPDFTQLAGADTLEVVSSNAGDTTQTVTVIGRDAQGRIVSQTVTLNGTSAVVFNTLGTVERVLSCEMSATAAGAVTLRRSDHATAVRVIPAGERGFSAIFRQEASSATTPLNYYAKFFWKNTNGANAALGAIISDAANPTGLVTFGLAATVNDSGTATNRQTAPAGIVFADTAQAVPGTDLAFGAAIGVWLLLALTAANAPIRSSYTSQMACQTT